MWNVCLWNGIEYAQYIWVIKDKYAPLENNLVEKKINTKRNKCISKLCIFRQKLSSKVFFLFYSSHPWRYSLFLWSNFVQYFNLSSVEMANLFIKFHNLSSSVLTARRKNVEWTFFENKLFQFKILLFFCITFSKARWDSIWII